MKYSIIVPVYNRPDEVEELLQSLLHQELTDFEVIIVEDGSLNPCREVCEHFKSQLDLHYYYKENSGPGQSRNYGAERATGDYLLILDSDVVLPKGYLAAITGELKREYADAFGGPDAAHESFTPTQKAISYAMTSFFTTGGIRGGEKKLDKFYPRSFNMGIRREVYEELGGFSKMRFGEDIDFSIRIFKARKKCRLFPKAWVWHKRRTDFRKFWRQVFNSGIARINLYKKYPDSLKLVHLLPMIFTLGVFLCVFSAIVALSLTAFNALGSTVASPARLWFVGGGLAALTLSPLVLYACLVATDSTMKNSSLKVGLLSVVAAFVQLMGYGCGFLQAWWRRCVLHKDEFQAYESTFYK